MEFNNISINLLDIVLFVSMMVSLVIGYSRGFVKETLSIINWLIAAWLSFKYYSDLNSMLPNCDFVSIHTPATSETKYILNKDTISLLPKHAVVINTSRGSTIDDDALIDALENKKIYAAGLDVFNNEPNLDKRYLNLDNCFVLPHVGSATQETRLAMSMMAVDNICCFFNKKPLISEVV